MSRGLGHRVAPAIVAIVAVIAISARAAAAPPAVFIVRQHIDAEVTSVDRNAREIRLKTDAGRFTFRDVGTTVIEQGTRVVIDVAVIRHPQPSGLPRAQAGPPPLATQRVRASVAGIDRGVGVAALASPAGRLTVEMPPDVLRTLRTGDSLWLDVAVHLAPEVSALPRDEDSRQKKSLKAFFLMLLGRTK
jgi:hypothetical protein